MQFPRRAGLRIVCAAVVGIVLAGLGRSAAALDGFWQPPGIRPAAATLSDVLHLVETHRGDVTGAYDERLRVVAGGRALPGEALVVGADVRYTLTVDGRT